MRTNIKMRVTPEQSKKVQEICFKNGISWVCGKTIINKDKPLLFISNMITYTESEAMFKDEPLIEVDSDLFIRTNGTCEEDIFERVNSHQLASKDKTNGSCKKAVDNINNLTILELQNKLKKKNELLKKARIKRKNQREELNKLSLKLQKCISLEEHNLRMETVLNEKHYLEVENKSLKDSSKISCNMLHKQKDKIDEIELYYTKMNSNYKKEIEKLKAIIEYLESKTK